jgi:hypothetical protein
VPERVDHVPPRTTHDTPATLSVQARARRAGVAHHEPRAAGAGTTAAEPAAVETAEVAEVVALAVRAFTDALRLSCLAAVRTARDPLRARLVNDANAAHRTALALAEEAVRRSTRA